MKIGNLIADLLGKEAEVVGSQGLLRDSIMHTFGAHADMRVIEEKNTRNLRRGLPLDIAIGNMGGIEVIARANSSLLRSVGTTAFEVVETLPSFRVRDKAPEGPQSGM